MTAQERDTEWPDEREPTPWWSGLLVSAFVTAMATAAVFGFGIALARVHLLLSIAVNIVAATGAAPTLWRWRDTPVVRWVVFGIAAGVALGWLGLLAHAL